MTSNIEKQNKLNKAYRATFSTAAGKEVMKDLIKFCHIMQPTFVPGDASASAFNEGIRRVGLRIMSKSNMTEKDVIAINKQLNSTNEVI